MASRQEDPFSETKGSSTCILFAVLVLLGGIVAGTPAAGLVATTPLSMSDEFMGFNFGKEHGLPDDDVRAILQTRDGSLWILTQQGLARFDGSGFTVFDRANSPDFESDDPRALAEDAQGRLWVGGKNLLLRMSGSALERVKLPGLERIVHSYPLCADPNGGMWIGGETTVALVEDGSVRVFGAESGLETGGMVRTLEMDPDGTLHVGTFDGFLRLNVERQQFERIKMTPRSPGKEIAALALHSGRARRFWAMFSEWHDPRYFHGFRGWLALQRGDSWEPILSAEGMDLAFSHGSLFVVEDSAGNVWLPAKPDGINRIRNNTLENLTLAFPRGSDVATCLREDHEGSLWMGTLQSGLWRWQPRRMRSHSAPKALPHENTWAVCEGLDGAMWVGTDGGLARFSDGRWEQWTTEHGLSRNNIRALAVDREGTVWIGTGEGLNSWRDGTITRHPIPGDWFESKIRAILPTREGALWVAGATGLHRLLGDQRTMFTTADGLGNNDVRALLEDSSGRLWIGTFGGGLQCYENGQFTTFSTTNGLASGFVWALHQDAEGGIWIGTESGLHWLRDGRIASFGRAHGLPDNLVNFILEDDWGQLWISHDRGIYRVRRSALIDLAEGRTDAVQCVSYTKADGLPSEETNGQKSYPPAGKARDGRLWFATTKGVVVIDPTQHHEEESPPPVVIERLRATGELVFSRDPQDPLSPERTLATNAPSVQHATNRSPMRDRNKNRKAAWAGGFSRLSDNPLYRLPPGSGRVLEFAFTANTFVNPERARFKYRLLGLDEKWIDAGTRRQAFFTNLKPGNYRFQVVAANHHGVWNETGTTCAFSIAPFFHETWWFYLLCGGTGLAAIGAFVVWRVRESRKIYRLERQAAVAAERSRIAQDLHDGLGADLTRLTTLAELASDASSQTSRDHLRKLARTSRETTRGLKDLIWMANPANDTLESFLDRLCQNAEEFLRDTQIRCRFDLAADLPPRPLSLEQRRNLLLVAREALNNVVKHSGATEVLITARWRGGNLELMIRDNGRGFDASAVRSGTMGLSGMCRRIENLGGQFELESSPEAGTRIRIQVKWQTADHAKPSE
ncbi:MAG: hypothetical protein KIS67_13810 [Verrucomicrobiae bacterium]|nr:hypothetical protein [Verrucomicrobiae bacterium]